MGELMDDGIIRMPYEMAMSDELSRKQFYSRANSLLTEITEMRAKLAAMDSQEPCIHVHHNYLAVSTNQEYMEKNFPGEYSSYYAKPVTADKPAVAVPDEWRGSLKEMVQAMRDYEMDVGEQAPEKHRRMMDTAEALLASPSHSQQSAATDAERFCDSHCTWRDHHPDCQRHESEQGGAV